MKKDNPSLRISTILFFWIPLASTWLMMSIEGPFLSAIIARLPDAKFNLAAYGVSFSLALIIEAPIIMLMSASTALVKDSISLSKLFRFSFYLNGLITIIMLILIIPRVFYALAEGVIGLPPEVSNLAYWATVLLLPWPSAIGFRRFYQGILIRNNKTRLVAYGTVIRLVSMASTGLILFFWGKLPGAYVGASALSVGVCTEVVASRLMVHSVLKRLRTEKAIFGDELTYGEIYRFYFPLAITLILSLGAHPLVTFFVGQSRMAIESLAVLPVINSFVFLFRSFGLSYQEVAIARVGEGFREYKPIRDFALILALFVTLALGFVAFTPLVRLWYSDVSGLAPDLTGFAINPTRFMLLLPALEVFLSLQRGLLVAGRKTGPITIGTVIELSAIILVLSFGILFFNWIGVFVATTALVVGRLTANLFLIRPSYGLLKRVNSKSAHQGVG